MSPKEVTCYFTSPPKFLLILNVFFFNVCCKNGKTFRSQWKIKGDGWSNMQHRQKLVGSESPEHEKHGECFPSGPSGLSWICKLQKEVHWGASVQLTRFFLELTTFPPKPSPAFPKAYPICQSRKHLEGMGYYTTAKEKVKYTLMLELLSL